MSGHAADPGGPRAGDDRAGRRRSAAGRPERAQREAVEHFEGPAAHTRRRRVGQRRACWPIAWPTSSRCGACVPTKCWPSTFTNKAAGEMRDRIGALVGPVARGHVDLDLSLHVRPHPAAARPGGWAYKSTFSIYDADDAKRLVKRCLAELST